MSKEQGFTCQTMHELGHYEAFKQGLDYKNERVAWDVAAEVVRSTFGSSVPEWWTRVREDVIAKASSRLSRPYA